MTFEAKEVAEMAHREDEMVAGGVGREREMGPSRTTAVAGAAEAVDAVE